MAQTGHAVRVTLTSRTFEVLAAFTPGRRSQRLADLAAATGLPLTTTHRIVGDLLRCGALERDPDGSLHVGLRLWEIGSLAPRGNALRDAALPFLEDLYVATARTSSSPSARARERLRRTPHRPRRRHRHDPGGHPLPTGLHRRRTGPPGPRPRGRPGGRPRPARPTLDAAHRHRPGRLRAALAEVRRTGVAVSDREVTPDAVSVAAPVRGPDGDVVAAVSLVVHSAGRLPRRPRSRRPRRRPRHLPGWALRLPLCGTSSGATPRPPRKVPSASHRLPPHRRDEQEDPRDRARRPRARDRQDLPAPAQRLVRRSVGPRGHREGPHGPHRRRPAPGPLPHPGRTPRRPRRRLLAPARTPVPGQARRPRRHPVPLPRPAVQRRRPLHRHARPAHRQPQRPRHLPPRRRALPLRLGLARRPPPRRRRPHPRHAPDGLPRVGRRRPHHRSALQLPAHPRQPHGPHPRGVRPRLQHRSGRTVRERVHHPPRGRRQRHRHPLDARRRTAAVLAQEHARQVPRFSGRVDRWQIIHYYAPSTICIDVGVAEPAPEPPRATAPAASTATS